MYRIRPTIFDFEIERNNDQKKALRNAWLTWAVFGIFAFASCYLGSIMGGAEGVSYGITIAIVSIFFWAVVSATYYDISVTPTPEQVLEHNKRQGIGGPGLPVWEDNEK